MMGGFELAFWAAERGLAVPALVVNILLIIILVLLHLRLSKRADSKSDKNLKQ